MLLNSYAKLNLYLAVLNKRRDSYHNIRTVFERIDLCDKITLKSSPSESIKIICSDPDVPTDSSNLCYRSAKLLKDNFDINKGIEIRIVKRIPVGAGLVGGSSNAAGVLTGLNRLWGLKLSQKKLAALAKSIGCDVPFFIYNTPFALGQGRGDKIKPLNGLKKKRLWHILVVPKIKVSTPLIYVQWDSQNTLTRPKSNAKILPLALLKSGYKFLFNSLEEITFAIYPQAKEAKDRLRGLGLKSILMSGSGPAVFGIVSSRKEAVYVSRQLCKRNKPWRVYVTRTR